MSYTVVFIFFLVSLIVIFIIGHIMGWTLTLNINGVSPLNFIKVDVLVFSIHKDRDVAIREVGL